VLGEAARRARRSSWSWESSRDYRSIVNIRLIPVFGLLPLDQVTRDQVRELVANLRTMGNKPKTIRNVLVPLSAIYEEAIEDGRNVQGCVKGKSWPCNRAIWTCEAVTY